MVGYSNVNAFYTHCTDITVVPLVDPGLNGDSPGRNHNFLLAALRIVRGVGVVIMFRLSHFGYVSRLSSLLFVLPNLYL